VKRDNNCFYKVADKDENTVTELLVNLMNKKYIRDLLLETLNVNRDVIQKIKYEDITTQYTIKNGKRPDIVISNNETLIFIENKIYSNTDLQQSQFENEYPEVLINSQKKNRKLIFIIPRSYTHIIEIKNSKNEFKDYLDIEIIYWENLLGALINADIAKDNPLINHMIQFIYDTIGLNVSTKSFNRGEVVYMYDIKTLSNIYAFIRKFDKYCFEAAGIIMKDCKEYINPKKITKEPHIDRHIAYWIESKDGGLWPIYIGLSFLEDPSFAYNIRILKNLFKNTIDVKEENYFEKESWYVFKIPNYVFNDDNIPMALACFVKEILKKYC